MIDIEEFKKRFPNMFRKLDYIEAPLGWKNLIEQMCKDIIKYETFFSHDSQYQPVAFVQIKEKFGSLRVYYDGGFINDEPAKPLLDVIRAYEDMSGKICSRCGSNVGVSHAANRGWIYTACKDCIT